MDAKNHSKQLNALSSTHITVHQNRCVTVRNRNVSCMRCAEACTSGCISLENGRLAVAQKLCSGCGTCATACPTCALEAHSPNDAELLARCIEAMSLGNGNVGICCSKFLEGRPSAENKLLVKVTCLGRIGESILVALAANGAKDVVLLHGECGQCKHEPGSNVSSKACETACGLLAAWGCATRPHRESEIPDHILAQNQSSLTDFPRSTSMKNEAAPRQTPPPANEREEKAFLRVMSDGTLPHFLPERHERILDSLASLGNPVEQQVRTRIWGRVSIDTASCSSCRMCSVFCPTGALSRFDEEDGSFGLEHYPGDCVQCRSCEAICRNGALTVSDEVFTADLVDGTMERIEMKRPRIDHNNPDSMTQALQRNCRAVLSEKR